MTPPSDIKSVILGILSKMGGRVPATKLVKLVYLSDYIYFQHFGVTITGLKYQWDQFGPNAVGHAIVQTAQNQAEDGSLEYEQQQENYYGGVTKYFSVDKTQMVPTLGPTVEMVLDDVVNSYGTLNVSAITVESKKTKPFREAYQSNMLHFEHQFPVQSASEEDVQGHLREMEDGGVSLEQIRQRYGT